MSDRRKKLKKQGAETAAKQGGRLEQRLHLVAQHFQGPLPAPELLEEYKRIHPESVEWILDQATEQGRHRRRIERRIVNWGTFNEFLGVTSALLVGLTAIGGGIFLIYHDKDGAGLTSIVGALSSLVIVYRTGRSKKQ